MPTKSRHSWRLHLGIFFAEVVCISAFVVEISRALSGNTLSWAYVAEWPILGVYAVYMWRKLLKDADHVTPASKPRDAEDAVKLTAWNEYLKEVHRPDHTDAPK